MRLSDLKRLALLMAVNCVRNTVIEDYHADDKLSDAEMKALNKEVADKLYTFLYFVFCDVPEDRELFLSAMSMVYPTEWDQPKLDSDLMEAIKTFKKLCNKNEPRAARLPTPIASKPHKGKARRRET